MNSHNFYRFTKTILSLLAAFLLVHCAQPVTPKDDGANLLPDINTANGIEIVTWNMQEFPMSGNATVDSVTRIMRELNSDIYAVQEVQGVNSLMTLVSGLENYAVIYSRNTTYMRLAIIYDTTRVTLNSSDELFVRNDYPFAGRPPLRADFTFHGDTDFDFSLVDLHMKCCSGADNVARRATAAGMLQSYIDSSLTAGIDTNWVVVGDWNNDIAGMSKANPYYNLWADSGEFAFETYSMATDVSDYNDSYPSWPSFLDHILVTEPLFDEADRGKTETLRVDDYFPSYFQIISDHRPVFIRLTPAG